MSLTIGIDLSSTGYAFVLVVSNNDGEWIKIGPYLEFNEKPDLTSVVRELVLFMSDLEYVSTIVVHNRWEENQSLVALLKKMFDRYRVRKVDFVTNETPIGEVLNESHRTFAIQAALVGGRERI